MKILNQTKFLKPTQTRGFHLVLLMGILPAIALSSCSAANRSEMMAPSAAKPDIMAKSAAKSADAMGKPAKSANLPESAPAPAQEQPFDSPFDFAQGKAQGKPSLPQLIKIADLSLIVTSIDDSMKAISVIVRQEQGDILGFQDSNPLDPTVRHRTSMKIQVPQERLDTTLNSLIQLGTIENRSLTAEDVSTQLVDNEARLRNLHKAEEMTLKIMERSGSISEVLRVSQELTNIRESIERIDAQQKSLKTQVAYSIINLTLSSPIPASPPPNPSSPSLGLRIQETWGKASKTITEISYSLVELSIWLFAFSPFLLLGWGIFFLYKRNKIQLSLPGRKELISSSSDENHPQ